MVPLPPWCHPLAATDAASPTRWARLPRAPRARRAVWRPQPLDASQGDCATLREERVLDGQGRHGATVVPCPGHGAARSQVHVSCRGYRVSWLVS